MIGLDSVILVLDGNSATFSPDRDGPVRADFRVRPVKLDIDVDGLALLEHERFKLVIALVEDAVETVVRRLDHVVLASLIPQVVARLPHASLVPSVGRHVDYLRLR